MLVSGILVSLITGCNYTMPKVVAFERYTTSQDLVSQGKELEAMEKLVQAVKLDPDLYIAHAALGDIHRKRGDYGDAVVHYRVACEKNSYAFRPHYNLAVTYQILAELAKLPAKVRANRRQAVNTYLRAITINPDDYDANLNLSVCYYYLGKYDLALQHCRTAVTLKPLKKHGHNNMGIIYHAKGMYHQAVYAYKNSLEVDTNQPDTLVRLGDTYMRQSSTKGRCRSALTALKLAIKMDPTNAAAYERMGVCHYRLRHYDLAMKMFDKALSHDRRFPEAYRGIGTVLMTQFVLDRTKTKLRDKAVEAWQTSLDLDPDQANLLKQVEKYAFTGKRTEL